MNMQQQLDLAALVSDRVWLGTKQSLDEVLMRLSLFAAGRLTPPAHGGYVISTEPDDLEDEPEDDDGEGDDHAPPTYYVDLRGSLAVITTSGPLTQEDGFMAWLFGGASYNSTRAAFMEAVSLVRQGHAKEVLHIIKSGGGQSTGLEETGALIRQVATDVCPVTTYGNLMCSAAYWLGMAASRVYAPSTANVGSIGTRMTIPNYFKALKDKGIDTHVLSAGKYKALGDPSQPWSKEAEDYLQGRVDDINDIFLEYVADYRGKTIGHVTEKMAQGREFTGKQAYDVGLTDGVVTLDALVQKMQAKLGRKAPSPPRKKAQALAAYTPP